jgi:nucleoside-diphosphate-sugar epimerase
MSDIKDAKQSELHVVMGAGQIGPKVARLLKNQGKRVRVVRQSSTVVEGFECVAADARDADALAKAVEGASVVYHCANPAYTAWAELLLPMTRGIVDATVRAKAKLVALDNVYMYSDLHRMNEHTVVAPRSKKGVLRAEAAQIMLDAHQRGDLPLAIGRAADFFGPETTLGAIFGDRFYGRVLNGQDGESFGNPDALHSYSYTPDVAAALAALGTASSSRGIYMLPVQPAESTRQVITRFYTALQRTGGVASVPSWVLRIMGWFNPMVGELNEMLYQWESDYVLDDSRIRSELQLEPTPWAQAIEATLAWAKPHYKH